MKVKNRFFLYCSLIFGITFMVIFLSAYCLYLSEEQTGIPLWALILLLSSSIIIIVILSRWLTNIAYKPFSNIIKEVNNIPTNKLNTQIQSSQEKDELQDLIDTFNSQPKSSEADVNQKNFINYLSHEFKMPLASILGNLDLFALKDHSPEEYRELSDKLIPQVLQMNETLDTLLVISNLREESSDRETYTRIDELLWPIIEKTKNIHPTGKILVKIDILPEEETAMLVKINRTQLSTALFNLIENAIRHSRKKIIRIQLFKTDDTLSLSIINKGTGISNEQLAHISKPFYKYSASDKGIGLSIALQILEANNISYKIDSIENQGTEIILSFESVRQAEND